MNLLAIETSGARGSVALSIGERLLERAIPTPRDQTELILPLVHEVLDAGAVELAGLDAIVFGRGPGSFTGLRVAAAVAQGLALASGRPLIGVSSSLIRQRVREKRSIRYLVPRSVEEYVRRHRLYEG